MVLAPIPRSAQDLSFQDDLVTIHSFFAQIATSNNEEIKKHTQASLLMVPEDVYKPEPYNKGERGGNANQCLWRATLSDKVIHPTEPRKSTGVEQVLPKVGEGVLKIRGPLKVHIIPSIS